MSENFIFAFAFHGLCDLWNILFRYVLLEYLVEILEICIIFVIMPYVLNLTLKIAYFSGLYDNYIAECTIWYQRYKKLGRRDFK